MKTIYKYIQKPYIGYPLFWVLVFLFSVATSSWYFSSTHEIIETYAYRVGLQFIIATIIVFILIPKLLNKNHKILFSISVFSLMYFAYVVCILIRINHLELVYPDSYVNYLKRLPDTTFLGRLINLKQFINTSIYLSYPTFLLLIYKFYKDQQALLRLNEQKKIAELTALKNQLNPHFLFNTLNNLYALAFKKSDKTMLVIQKLSSILDYTLYGCNEKYVSIHKEVDLIENYLALEKIRYDDRVTISFKKYISKEVKIAPLVLLTFIENAFKHGVSQELTKAIINIELTQKNKEIDFKIENTKPKSNGFNDSNKEEIGLKNVKKQLSLLYQNNYSLHINEEDNWYKVHLKLKAE